MKNRIQNLEKQRDALDEQIEDIKRNTFIKCEFCKKRTKVCNLTYIVEMYWNYAYDDWYEGDQSYNCPKCGKNNRLYDREDVQELRWYFKDQVKKDK